MTRSSPFTVPTPINTTCWQINGLNLFMKINQGLFGSGPKADSPGTIREQEILQL